MALLRNLVPTALVALVCGFLGAWLFALSGLGGGATRDWLLAHPEILPEMAEAYQANEARERGLDKTPAGALALARAEEAALVELLRRDLASQSPQPSDDEARRFISENPAMFADRFITVVEQVVTPQITPALLKQMEPIETLDGIRALLDQNRVPYTTTMGSVDSLTVQPAVARQLVGLGVGEVYILPQGPGARINAVVSRKAYPIAGDKALNLAREMLGQQRANGQAQSVFKSVIDEKKRAVRYADTYSAPAPAKAPGAGAAPAQSPQR